MGAELSPLTLCFLRALGLMFVCLICHIPLTRLMGNSRFVFRSLFLALAIAFVFYFYQVITRKDFLVPLIDLFFFLGLWNMLLVFIINLLNSFSLRMVGEIYLAKNQYLRKEDLDKMFSDEDSFNSRLRAMEANGFLSVNPNTGEIVLSKKGFSYGRFFKLLRSFLGIKVYG